MRTAGCVMDDYWELQVEDYGTVRFKKKIIEELSEFIQKKSTQNESGGILLGKHLNSGGRIVIDDYTSPQPKDLQTRLNFFRSLAHSEIARKKWIESDGHCTFVGLWHTHPEAVPEPSVTDLKDWSNTLNNSRYEGKHLFFIILGQSCMRCWIGEKSKKSNKISFVADYSYGS